MKTQELLERFIEEINYMTQKDTLLIMAYGSRITDSYRPDSDLDIFIITEYKKFIASLLIDGIKVEIHGFSINDIKRDIMFCNASGNMYLKSVLKTGKVLKDSINLYEELCNLLEYQIIKKTISDYRIL